MKNILIWSAPLLVMTAPAWAQETKPTLPGPTVGSDITVKAKKTCRVTAVTGRRIPETTCRTNEQWEQSDKANEIAARETLERIVRQATYVPPPLDPGRGLPSNSIMGLETQPR